MSIILAHVNGPSGGGKTTIGNKINEKYPFVKSIDIDVVLIDDLPTMFPKAYMKYIKKNEREVFGKKYLYKGLQLAIKPYKYVILVGNVKIPNLKTGEFYNLENIDTENKFSIDIDHDLLLERRIKRHFKTLVQHEDIYYKKIIKKRKLEINLDVWEGDRMYWGHTREKFYEKCERDGYEIINQDEIIKKISTIIENNVQELK
jgi:adenylate kinase family enzyme